MQSNLNITSIPSTSSISSKSNDKEESDEKVKRKEKGGKEGKGDREEKNRERRSIVVPKFMPISPSAPPALWMATPPPHYPGGLWIYHAVCPSQQVPHQPLCSSQL